MGGGTNRRVMQRHPPLGGREETGETRRGDEKRRERVSRPSHRPIRYSEDSASRGRVSSAATWKKNTSRDGPEKSLSRWKERNIRRMQEGLIARLVEPITGLKLQGRFFRSIE